MQQEPTPAALAQGLKESRPIEPDNGEHRTRLDRDVKGLGPFIIKAQQCTEKNQVTGGGDRQKLGEALNHAHEQRLDLIRKRAQQREHVIHNCA